MIFKVPDVYLKEYTDCLNILLDLNITESQLSKFLAQKGIIKKMIYLHSDITNHSYKRKLRSVMKRSEVNGL